MSSCSRICGCVSPPIVPMTARSEPSGRVTSAGASVCGGRRPGPYSAGWPGSSEKPMPRLCRPMPVAGSNSECSRSPDAFDWINDTPMRSASTAHRYMVSPVARGARSCRTVRRVDQRAAARRPRRRRAGRHVRVLRAAPKGGRAPRHAPPRRAGAPSRCPRASSGRSSPSAIAAPEQREVALRVRRDRPHVVVPHADMQRFDPVGQRLREIGGRVLARRRARAALRRTGLGRSRRVRGRRWPRARARRPDGGPDRRCATDRCRRDRRCRGRRWSSSTAAASSGEAGNPLAAYPIAGSSTAASGSRP